LCAIIYSFSRQAPELGQIRTCKQASIHESFQVDEIRIACKSREALVGRIAESGWAKRANLPCFQPGIFQEVDEKPRFSPQRADAGRAG
jgi:hypothetical protein